MNNSQALIGYHPGESVIHRLSGAAKMLFFILVSVAAMTSYDTRFLIFLALASLCLFRLSGIRLKDVSLVLILAIVFAALNLVMIYLFAPQYGTEIYRTKTVLLQGIGSYQLTAEEVFYLLNVLVKYFCTVPLALLFLMTTHPSQFAASLNQIGVPYKIAYSVALTLRYIPDMQEEFYMIKKSQEARGLELSSKGKLSQRIKGNLQIVTPLIFSSLERIEVIATAMELRRFGKGKGRSWYMGQRLGLADYLSLLLAALILGISLFLFSLNGGRFYNPFI